MKINHIKDLLWERYQMPARGAVSFAKEREIHNRITELNPEEFTHLVYLVIPDQMRAIIKKCNLEPDPRAWQWWIVQEQDFGYAWHHKVTMLGLRIATA